MSRLQLVVWIAIALGTGCASIRTADDRTCAGCSEPIRGKFVDAGGTYFHPPHFTCAHCEEPIGEDSYIPYGEKQYHESCYAGHVIRCAHCDDPDKVDSFVTYKGKSYHSSCAREQVVTCAYCDKTTDEDTFVAQDSKNYHKSCFGKHVVPCAFCGNPIGGKTYTSSKGKNYHSSCYQEFVVPRCTLCRGVIDGEYITDYWGGSYHPSHKDDSPACDFCGRLLRTPLDRGGVKYDDGRFQCGSCRSSAVTTVKEVQGLARDVSGRLRRVGIDVDSDAISFRVVGAGEMRRLNRHSRHKPTGLTDYLEVVGVPGRTTYENIKVYVLRGMPRVQMTAAIAHELTHVWQLLHGRLKINRTLAEGSCEYASYLVLQKIPGGESEYLLHTMTTSDGRIYGKAFRRVKQYAEENGIPRWLTLLKNNEPLPVY